MYQILRLSGREDSVDKFALPESAKKKINSSFANAKGGRLSKR